MQTNNDDARRIGRDPQRTIALALLPPIAVALVNAFYLQAAWEFDQRLYWAADFGHFVLLGLALAVYLRVAGGLRPRDYGFGRLPRTWTAVDTVAIFAFTWAALYLAYAPVNRIALHFLSEYANAFNYGVTIPSGPGLHLLVAVYYSATAALLEEAVFRSLPWLYLQRYRRSRWMVPVYITGTATLFAAVHWEQGPHALIACFTTGLAAAWIYQRIRNAWPLVFAHFVIDLNIFL